MRNDWILTDDIDRVFAQLIAKGGQGKINGHTMALVTECLIAAEVKPGGPYRNALGQVTRHTNQLVDSFLQSQGITLPSLTPFRSPKPVAPPQKHVPRQYTHIQHTVAEELSNVPSPFKEVAARKWQAVQAADNNYEIGLMTYWSVPSNERARKTNIITQLGVANFFTWMAYMMYDDFYDGQGAASELPFAHWAARRSLQIYLESFPHAKQHIYEVFSGMDEANLWELQHARAQMTGATIHLPALPDYGKYQLLANRALAHCLGPILLSDNDPKITKALKHYLIAKQLLDDLHDWRGDVQAGHLSPVVVYLINAVGYKENACNTNELTKKMQHYFWRSGLEEMCSTIDRHARVAHAGFPRGLQHLIKTILETTTAARQERQDNQQFLETMYRMA